MSDVCFRNDSISVETEPELTLWQRGKLIQWEVRDVGKRRRAPRVRVLPGGVVGQQLIGGQGRVAPGGRRGEIYGLSAGAARRLRRKLMAIRWSEVDAMHIVLDWHNDWPGEPEGWKLACRRFMARLEYHMGGLLGYVWRLEFQRRGCPHFHLILVWKKQHMPEKHWFRRYCRDVWLESIDGVGDIWLAKFGVRVRPLQERPGSLGQLLTYLSCDVAKSEQARLIDITTGEIMPTGRCWGVRGAVPLSEGEVVNLTDSEWAVFCERVSEYGKAVARGWYMASVNSEWLGFALFASLEVVASWLDGLGATYGRVSNVVGSLRLSTEGCVNCGA